MGSRGNPAAFHFPRAMASAKTLDFSFSGLKTALRHFLEQRGEPFVQEHLQDVAASYQEAVVDSLLQKLSQAISLTRIPRVVLSGGVAANSRLRARMQELADREALEVFFPSPFLCTDNAAMIAAAGTRHLQCGETSPLSLNADPNLQL